MPRRVTRSIAVSCLLSLVAVPAWGQRYIVKPGVRGPENRRLRERSVGDPLAPTTPEKRSENDTTVEVDVLVSGLGGGLDAQRWSRVFRDIGFSVQIRSARATDELGVTEKTLGPLRRVNVVGQLDRDGSIRFADRRFGPDEGAKLKEWLDELQTYGAQGSPEGQPLWGLDKSQFGRLHRALAAEPTEGVAGASLAEVLKRVDVPERYPLRLSEATREHAAQSRIREATVNNDLTGLSTGTTLAIALSEFGLGFHPERTPGGRIELVVDPLAERDDAWPAGWEFDGARQPAMPKMFQFVPVRFDDAKLKDVLHTIATKTEVPIHVDHHGLAAKELVFDELRTSYPFRKTSWSLLLRGVLGPHKLTREFRTDEAGNLFVWVTPFVPRPIDRD